MINPTDPVPVLLLPPFKFEDEILVYVTEEVEEIPLGHPDNPVEGIAKLLLYASLA